MASASPAIRAPPWRQGQRASLMFGLGSPSADRGNHSTPGRNSTAVEAGSWGAEWETAAVHWAADDRPGRQMWKIKLSLSGWFSCFWHPITRVLLFPAMVTITHSRLEILNVINHWFKKKYSSLVTVKYCKVHSKKRVISYSENWPVIWQYSLLDC